MLVVEPRTGATVRFHMVRLDPALIDFEVHYVPRQANTISGWQEETGAWVVVKTLRVNISSPTARATSVKVPPISTAKRAVLGIQQLSMVANVSAMRDRLALFSAGSSPA